MQKNLKKFILILIAILSFTVFQLTASAESILDQIPPEDGNPEIEVVSPYLTLVRSTLPDGKELIGARINGPPEPPGAEEGREASILPLPDRGVISSFPSYDWVFGCSAVSGAMIAAYYDNNGYANMYTGPTNGGVMPLTDTSWSTWYSPLPDAYDPYPNNPLIASHNGIDGRATKGSIDDYWWTYNSSAADPFIGNWTEHTWGSAIGDYMKTSQSNFSNVDGSTWFYNYGDNTKLYCSAMTTQWDPTYSNWISNLDGTYGRKLFYEAKGYTVTDCFNQLTDNQATGGFSLADFQAEIDAGHPVLINLLGHSMVGYGYSGSTIYIRDTWDNNTGNTYTMTWGGSYPPPPQTPMDLYSVSIVKLAPLTTPPAAPTGVSASDGAYTDKVRVSWTASSGATYYKVFRNTSNTHSGETELTSSHGSSPFDDTSATPGTTYYYWVQACNTGGCSSYSSHDTGYRAITPPAAPTGVSASDGAYTDKVRVSWTASSGATYYKVFRNTSNTHAGETTLTASHGASPYDDTSATPSTPYYYWVQACNTAGCSGYSSHDIGYRATTPTPPVPPTGVSASDDTYTTKVEVSWSASSGATYYKVFRNTSNTHTGETTLISSHPASPYDDTSATPGITYWYWVQACNSAGCSGYSSYDTGRRDTASSENYLYLPLITGGTGTSSDLIQNGDFESGQNGSWTEFSSGGYDLIYGDIDWAQSGSWIAYLGGYDDATDQLSQSVTISASRPYLHFWYLIDSEDVCGYDYSYIVVDGIYEAYAELCVDTSTSDWAHAVIDLSSYAGSTVSLMFEVVTDSSLISHFFLDTVSMSSSSTASMNNGIFVEGTPQNIEIHIKPNR